MTVPSDAYLEAFEKGHYQTAAEDEELVQAWQEDGDPLARAFLVLAAGYLDAAHGDQVGAQHKFREVAKLLEGEDGFKPTAVRQTAEQALEYLGLGKPLPDLPGGL